MFRGTLIAAVTACRSLPDSARPKAARATPTDLMPRGIRKFLTDELHPLVYVLGGALGVAMGGGIVGVLLVFDLV